MTEVNKGGRPSLYNGDMLEKIKQYISHFQDPESSKMKTREVTPTMAGLAIYLGITKKTLYNWAENNEELLHAFDELQDTQETILISGGLSGEFNAPISKLILTNHGYSDKQVIDNTSSDGSMTPKPVLSKEEMKEAVKSALDKI